jgi:hypothetical protein
MRSENVELIEEIRKFKDIKMNNNQIAILNGFQDKFANDSFHLNPIDEYVPELLRHPMNPLPSNPVISGYEKYFEYVHIWGTISVANHTV